MTTFQHIGKTSPLSQGGMYPNNLACFNLDFCLVRKQCGPPELYAIPVDMIYSYFSNGSKKIQPLMLLLSRKAYKPESKNVCDSKERQKRFRLRGA